MPAFAVEIARGALKALKRIDPDAAGRIVAAIDALASDRARAAAPGSRAAMRGGSASVLTA
jgi:hypothetical protein